MDNQESIEGKFGQKGVFDRKSRIGSKFLLLDESEINKEIRLRAMINVDLC